VRIRKGTLSPLAFRRIAVAALVSLVVITITGAAVRLTESGLGCSDWPTCESDELIPEFEYHAWIEFGNRLFTGVVSIAVVAAALGAWLRSPRRRDLTRLSWLLVLGVPMQAVVGAIVVLSELNPWAVLPHFLLSIVLVWIAVLLVYRAGIDDDEWVAQTARVSRPHAWVISTLTSVAIVLGALVTGSGPHTGNRKGEVIERLPLEVASIARLHGTSVVFLLVAVVATFWWLRQNGATEREVRLCSIVLVILLLQGTIGYVQYFTGVPALLVGIHVFGATMLWIAVLWFHLNSAASPIELPDVAAIGRKRTAAVAQ